MFTKSCENCTNKYTKIGTEKGNAFKFSKFCSLSCKGDFQRINKTGSKNPNFRGGNSFCIDCNVDLKYRYPSKKEPRCKPCCYKQLTGEKSPHWKGGLKLPSCINCSGQTGDMQSILCRKCYRGKLSPLWRGGVSTIANLIRALPENRQWIKQCMFRDNYSCLECGVQSKGNNLQVHHIKQFALILKENNIDTTEKAIVCDELWNLSNGMTLCRECHKLTENFNRKVN